MNSEDTNKDKKIVTNDISQESTNTTQDSGFSEEKASAFSETPEPPKHDNNKGKRIARFLKNNILALVLLLALIIVSIWLTVKNSNQEKQFLQEKTELVTNYETTIDSLKIDYIKFATEVFSWSVRSEMLRNNEENLNQLVSVFVKESNVQLVQIVDIENKNVILSSDKKYEGEPYTGTLDASSKTTVETDEEGKQKIIVPIMGFNSKIGILIVTI